MKKEKPERWGSDWLDWIKRKRERKTKLAKKKKKKEEEIRKSTRTTS